MAALRISDGRCQFCHRTASDVQQLIAGDSAFICSECVQACTALLRAPAEPGEQEDTTDRYVYQRLARHFAPLRPQEMIATSRTYPLRQQADLQMALDDLFGERRIPENFLGIHQQYRHEILGFSKLLDQSRSAIEAAPAQYEDIDIGAGETVRCLKNGLWLLRDEHTAYAIVLSQHDDYGRGGDVIVEVAAPPGERGAALCTRVFDALELRLSKGSCYRGRVLSLEQRYHISGHAPRWTVCANVPMCSSS